MPGLAKTSRFLLSQATVMVGATSALNSLNPSAHALGLVKNFQVVNEPSYTELMQGTMNEVVESIKTNDALRCSAEIYEYTPKNLAYAAGLDGTALTATNQVDFALDVDVAAAASTVVVTGDATSEISAGSFIVIQDSGVNSDSAHIARVATAAVAAGKTTITLAAGFAVPAGVTFSKLTSKVRHIEKLEIGGDAYQPYLSMKVVGVLPKDGRAIVMLFPKVKITKGLSLTFQTDNFSNMPFEFTPYPLVQEDALYTVYPGRRMILFPG
jgi:hypothetical protein